MNYEKSNGTNKTGYGAALPTFRIHYLKEISL